MIAQVQQFWYTAVITDIRGVAVTKEGDVPGNNAMHAIKVIENMNRNSWKGTMIRIELCLMDFESGQILRDNPVISWNRYGTGEKQVRNMDWDPSQYDNHIPQEDTAKTSHSVSLLAHEIGTTASFTSTFTNKEL